MVLNREQTYLLSKYFLISFTIMTIIATFVAYGVVIHEINRLSDKYPDQRKSWRAWRAFIIFYLILEDLVSLVGLFGAFKENLRLVLSYGVIMSVLWFFNFANYAILDTNVFNYLMALGAICSAFYFAKRIRQNQLLIVAATTPQGPAVIPTASIIQVQSSYIPSPSGISSAHYVSTDPQTTDPPPNYSNVSQPKLEFKY